MMVLSLWDHQQVSVSHQEDGEVGKVGAGKARLIILTAVVCENYSVVFLFFLKFLIHFTFKKQGLNTYF